MRKTWFFPMIGAILLCGFVPAANAGDGTHTVIVEFGTTTW